MAHYSELVKRECVADILPEDYLVTSTGLEGVASIFNLPAFLTVSPANVTMPGVSTYEFMIQNATTMLLTPATLERQQTPCGVNGLPPPMDTMNSSWTLFGIGAQDVTYDAVAEFVCGLGTEPYSVVVLGLQDLSMPDLLPFQPMGSVETMMFTNVDGLT